MGLFIGAACSARRSVVAVELREGMSVSFLLREGMSVSFLPFWWWPFMLWSPPVAVIGCPFAPVGVLADIIEVLARRSAPLRIAGLFASGWW
jgi:hypothetical protein